MIHDTRIRHGMIHLQQVLGDKGPGSTDSLSQQRENVDDLVAQILGSKDSTPPHCEQYLQYYYY